MPSPTSRTRPSSRATALPRIWSISRVRTETISSALNRMTASLDELFADHVKTGADAGVVDPVVLLYHQSPQQTGVDGGGQYGFLPERGPQLAGQPRPLVVAQGDGGSHAHLHAVLRTV